MLFSSISFLYVFMPAVLVFYFIAPVRYRNYILLIASLAFYFLGEPIYTLLLIFSSLSDYLHSLFIEKYRKTKYAKPALISSIIINLAILGFFKYADFFIANFNGLTGAEIELLRIALPLGISFYTFQTMSYTIDVYRGDVKAEKNFAAYATYVCLFPQLIAGPVVRYNDIAVELHQRNHSIEGMAHGIRRFVIGLAKKVIIANSMGELCEIFRASDEKTVLFYWLYGIAFTLQIYFDFSGYSDMAIGLGKMFGFNFLENFNYPYISKTITEFWRRWHISLGTWFRDYVYIPLGGSRVSKWKWVCNILVVWFLTGFWHGAEWNFIVWGLVLGFVLVIEKLLLSKLLDKLPAALSWMYTMFVIVLSMVIFNGEGLGGALYDIKAMFGAESIPLWNVETLYYLRNYIILLLIAVLGATPAIKNLFTKIWSSKSGKQMLSWMEPVVLTLLLMVVTAYLIDGSFNPFLYFRF